MTSAVLAAVVTIVPGATAGAADRMRDKDVKDLIERINHERDRFEDQLDGKLKRSIVRGPRGDVDVERYLDDLQENVNKLKERFTREYGAGAEALTVLRQGSDIQRAMATVAPDLDGASEWNRLAGSLSELAVVYGTTFPLPEGASVRRLNDDEVRKAAQEAAKGADRFKKELNASLKHDAAIDTPAREAALDEVDGLKRDAQKLASTMGDEKPASGEAQALLTRASKIRAAASGRPLSPAAQSAWGALEGSLDKVALAFALTAREP